MDGLNGRINTRLGGPGWGRRIRPLIWGRCIQPRRRTFDIVQKYISFRCTERETFLNPVAGSFASCNFPGSYRAGMDWTRTSACLSHCFFISEVHESLHGECRQALRSGGGVGSSRVKLDKTAELGSSRAPAGKKDEGERGGKRPCIRRR